MFGALLAAFADWGFEGWSGEGGMDEELESRWDKGMRVESGERRVRKAQRVSWGRWRGM